MLDTHDNITEHLNKTPIGIPGKTIITALVDQGLDHSGINAQVQNCIHHTRHGYRCSGTDRNKQRVLGVPEFRVHGLFQLGQIFINFFLKA